MHSRVFGRYYEGEFGGATRWLMSVRLLVSEQIVRHVQRGLEMTEVVGGGPDIVLLGLCYGEVSGGRAAADPG